MSHPAHPPERPPRALPPDRSRARRLWQRRLRSLRSLGWQGWLVLGRRLAPWALLAFALVQVRALSDKLRQVEERQLSQVEGEIGALQAELARLRSGAEAVEAELGQTRAALQSLDQSLEQARRRAPELARVIDEAHRAGEAVRSQLPSADVASRLGQSLEATGSQVAQVRAALPTQDQGAQLAAGLDGARRSLEEVRAHLPEAEKAAALGRSLDQGQQRAEAVGKALEADLAAVASLKGGLPTEEQLAALRRDLARAREVLARVPETARLATSAPVPEPAAHPPAAAAPAP